MSYSSPSPEGPISAAEPLTSPAGPPDEIESVSGADQLLSSAFVNGLSDPYDPAQGGWTSGPLPSDPYTGLAMGGDAYTGGPAGDLYSGATTANDNPNFFTGGRNIDPMSGLENVGYFAGGGDETQASPIPTNSPPIFPWDLRPEDMPQPPDFGPLLDQTPAPAPAPESAGPPAPDSGPGNRPDNSATDAVNRLQLTPFSYGPTLPQAQANIAEAMTSSLRPGAPAPPVPPEPLINLMVGDRQQRALVDYGPPNPAAPPPPVVPPSPESVLPPETFLKFRLSLSLGSGTNPTEPDFGLRLTWNGKGILGQGDNDARTGDQFPEPLTGGLRVPGIGGTLHGSVFGDDVTAGATYQREFGRGDEGYGRLDLSIGVLAGNRDLAINPSIPDGIPANSESFAFHSSATTLQESLSFPFLQPGPSVGATAVVTDNRNFEVGVSAGISLVLPQSVPLIGGALADYTFYDADHPHAAGGAAGSLLDLIVGNPKIMGSSVWNQQTDAGLYGGIRAWGRFAGF